MSQEPLGITGRATLLPAKSELAHTDLRAFAGEFAPDSPVSFSRLLRALTRRWKLITAVFVTMLMAVVAVTVVVGQNYESEFKILVKARTDPMGSVEAGGGPRAGIVTEEDINSEVALLKSHELLARVVELHHLDKPGDLPWSAMLEKYQGGGPEARTDRALRRLASNLRVEAVKKSNIIEVSYAANKPAVAAEILKTLADLYLARHVQLHQNRGAYDFFALQADQWQVELAKAEAELAKFGHATASGAPQQERDLMLQKMADMRAAEAQRATDTDAALERYRTIQSTLAATPPRLTTQVKTADNAQLLGQLKTTLLNLQLKRTDLAAKFAPGYPALKELDEQIAQALRAIDAESTHPVIDNSTDQNPTYQWLAGELAKVQVEMPALRVEATSAQRNVARTEQQVMKLSDASIVRQALLRKVQVSEQNYALYQQKRELARISDELDKRQMSNVILAEEPAPSVLPVRSIPVTIAMGVLFCLMISGGVGFAADYLDPTFRTWLEVEVSLNAPVLAAVPAMAADNLLRHRVPLEIEHGTVGT